MTRDVRIAIPVPTSRDLEYNQRSWGMYAAAVEEAGGIPVRVDLAHTQAALMRTALTCQGLLLPGSPADVDPQLYGQQRIPACAPADEARGEMDRLLLEDAFKEGKPVLGICYGVQSLNTWRGGTLVQDLACVPVNHEAGSAVAVAHSASVVPSSLLGSLIDAQEAAGSTKDELRLMVNSSHHQAVEQVGTGLQVVALSTQDGVVEAIEGAPGSDCPPFVVGVQWHPERSTAISATSRAIFSGFLNAAEVWVRVERA